MMKRKMQKLMEKYHAVSAHSENIEFNGKWSVHAVFEFAYSCDMNRFLYEVGGAPLGGMRIVY